MTYKTAFKFDVFVMIFVILSLCPVFPLTAWSEDSPSSGARLTTDHLFKLGTVSDPQPDPNNEWLAYTVSRSDLEEDKSLSRVWMVRAAGGDAVAMTAGAESSSHPRWSPDGRFLAFLSSRDDGPTQVWTLFHRGGEAVQLTDTAQSVNAFEWSPDGKRMLLLLQDPTPEEMARKEQGEDYEEKTQPPWVIDRLQFKSDYVGYLDRRRKHIHILDIETKALTQLTSGDYDHSEPSWSPDGSRIVFTSNRSDDPDNNYNTDIWTIGTDPENARENPLRVSNSPGPDADPAWSPDGKWITHTSVTDTAAMLYATSHLAISSAKGGNSRSLTEELDRMIFSPRFSPDGGHIWFLLEDSGEQNLARIDPENGTIERKVTGVNSVRDFSFGKDHFLSAVVSRPQQPSEIFQLTDGKLNQLTFVNQDLITELKLGAVEKIGFQSKDGTEIETFVIKPPGFIEGKKYPIILDIHGGPQAQYDFGFHFEGQLYAANDYLVVQPNPRGSTGYGQEFCKAIWLDWGGPDYEDVMGAVDEVIELGWADPERMAVTGWSYGGMLTNHVITKTDRFKAAATGASATLYVVNYGHDMYQRWWEQELGLPWEPEARARYEKISPFNQVDKVVTPTLILGGEKDWNVPIINSEQLYIALKRLGVETELVVYPGEYHGIDTPSHSQDLYQRYLNWFGKYLNAE
jgi:dipeptidyl aminopeptidase/acylaminoacyl peptidase